MQKWLPDAFAEDAVVVGLVGPSASFETEPDTSSAKESQNWSAALFRGEAGFADPATLLAHLTQVERDLICHKIQGEIADSLKAEEAELAENFAAKLAEQERLQSEAFEKWCQNFQEAMTLQIRECAAASARLALQLAERIVRAAVEVDQGVLTRAVENTLYKVVDAKQISITVNPDDAALFRKNPQATSHLPIHEIFEDRRIERGGCLVSAGNLEWDATLGSQLDTLRDVVEEAIAVTKTSPDLTVPAEGDQGEVENHESGLE